MAAVTIFLFMLLPMFIASVVVAVLPLRSPRVRVVVLGLHVLLSTAAIVLLPGPWLMYFGSVGIGLVIAVIRLVYTIPALRDRKPWDLPDHLDNRNDVGSSR
jgi:hypothetical protein